MAQNHLSLRAPNSELPNKTTGAGSEKEISHSRSLMMAFAARLWLALNLLFGGAGEQVESCANSS